MHQSYTTIPGYARVHVQTNATRLRKQAKDETAAREEAEVCFTALDPRSLMLPAQARLQEETAARQEAEVCVAASDPRSPHASCIGTPAGGNRSKASNQASL
jgi:hypothetical protein